ncbi:MAG: Hsp20/alpha crystallin family protein [Solobacterium sp.]|nr:Hsp20/alpha crystallin family protein [Solobacterium sp.]MBR3344296.1 Hsp20/alpha crystallin family protein [Solobacterium sp.]MBR3346227.1 Hsp20/alpha crystallin family protein [Solobacterium sp.]
MLMPSIFRDNLFDDWMDDFSWMRDFGNVDRKLYGKHAGREMLTDVRDHEDHYEVEIDLPGFKKDQIQVELHDGTLTITAQKGLEQNDKNSEGKYVRQERYSGMMSRSFYVGENMTEEDIKAKFEDGVLKLNIPKKEEKKLPEKKTIMIEG